MHRARMRYVQFFFCFAVFVAAPLTNGRHLGLRFDAPLETCNCNSPQQSCLSAWAHVREASKKLKMRIKASVDMRVLSEGKKLSELLINYL